MTAQFSYYQEVVKITELYLGPAAERFINRQIEFHLAKPPEDITKADVVKLRDSVRVALGLLINDKQTVDEAVDKFETLIKL